MKVVVISGIVEHSGEKYGVSEEFTCSKKDGDRLIALNKVKEVKGKLASSTKSTNPPKKTQAEQMEEGMFEQLQEEAKALGIDTEGKDFETLKAEVEGFVE